MPRKHQARAIHNFLHVDCREEIFNERLSKLTLHKSIGDDEAKLSVRFQQAEAQLEEGANE